MSEQKVPTASDDGLWLSETIFCRIEQLAEVSGLSIDEIEDLIDTGIIEPVDEAPATHATRSFTLSCMLTVKTARRLRDDFELDRHGLAVALRLMQRIRALEQQLNDLHARSAVFPVSRNETR